MNILSPVAAASATPLPLVPSSGILAAANLLLPHLECGERIDVAILRDAMETAFGASDTSGVWDWKAAYDTVDWTPPEGAHLTDAIYEEYGLQVR